MKIKRSLTVCGNPQQLESVLAQIRANLVDGWSRATDIESRRSNQGDRVCFLCSSNSKLSPFFIQLDHDIFRLKLTDIVAQDLSLSISEFNALAGEFLLRYVHEPAQKLGLTVDFGPDEWEPARELCPRAARLLRAFAAMSNRSVTHPLDHRRWLRVVAALGLDKERKCDPEAIRGWLLEQGWAAKTLDQLIPELEFGLKLMRAYVELPPTLFVEQ